LCNYYLTVLSAEEDFYFEPSLLGEKELVHFEPLLTEIQIHFTKLMEVYQAKEEES